MEDVKVHPLYFVLVERKTEFYRIVKREKYYFDNICKDIEDGNLHEESPKTSRTSMNSEEDSNLRFDKGCQWTDNR